MSFKSAVVLSSLCFAVSGFAAEIEMVSLEKADSLAARTSNGLSLSQIIERSHVRPTEIEMGFDMDGTLFTYGEKVRDEFEGSTLRGGQETRDVFKSFSREGIQWFVVSKNPNRSLVADRILRMKLDPFIHESHKDGDQCLKDGEAINYANRVKPYTLTTDYDFGGKKYSVYRCMNSIAATAVGQGGSAPDKHAAIEFIYHHFFAEAARPKLLIFVDDSAANLIKIYKHYKESAIADLKVVLVIWQPHLPEPDHSDAFREMQDFMRRSARK